MDNNPATTTIAASDVALYQMHGDGTIWTYTGPPIAGGRCWTTTHEPAPLRLARDCISCMGWHHLGLHGSTRKRMANPGRAELAAGTRTKW